MPPATATSQTTPMTTHKRFPDSPLIFIACSSSRTSREDLQLDVSQILADGLQKLSVLQRLVQIGSTPAFEAPSDDVVSAAISEQDDGSFCSPALASQLAAHLQTVHAGHHHIEKDQVRSLGIGQFEAVRPVVRGHDLV